MSQIRRRARFVQRLGRFIDTVRRLTKRRASTADRIPRQAGGEFGEPVDRAAAVCYRRVAGSIEFKLVRARGGGWTFPKGHIEEGEQPWAAAQREALEEAGIRGPVESEPLAIFPHEKRKQDGRRVELTVAAYLLHVESESDTPEPGRDPTWFPPDQAKQKLAQGRAPRYQQACTRLIDEARKKLEHQS